MKRRMTIWPWMMILLMIGSVLWMMNRLSRQVHQASHCKENLEKIYHILTLYEVEHGQLPSFELFPEDPLEDAESLPMILKSYGLDLTRATCPSSPNVLREYGVSYLWNTALNHDSLTNRHEPTWVLVDMQALDDRLPGPHFGGYHILYTDGRVERTPHPPHSLPVQFD